MSKPKQNHLASVLKSHPGLTEKKLAEASTYGIRNKKFADCLRRAMKSGLIKRELWRNLDGRLLWIYYIA